MKLQHQFKQLVTVFCLGILLVFSHSGLAVSCTGFFIRTNTDQVYVNSVEGWVSTGMVLVNKRGTIKTAFIGQMGHKPLVWTAKYGSVTFNNVCQDSPNGGMNEVGLTVSGLLMADTRYPDPDDRPVISLGQWKQYVLDMFETVDQVIAADRGLRIVSPTGKYHVHYFLTDRTGKSAVIEYINGIQTVYSDETLPVGVIVNRAYADSLKAYKNGEDSRFARVARQIERFQPASNAHAITFAFDQLAELPYVWGIAYDTRNLKIHYRTDKNRGIKSIDLSGFDFSCRTPARVMDVNIAGTGDITDRFEPFTPQRNRDHVNQVESFYRFSRYGMKEILGNYSTTVQCQEK